MGNLCNPPPHILTLSTVSVPQACSLRESRGEIVGFETGRVRGKGEVVAVAETWGERCCTVGMWDMLSNFSVWITAHRPSNPFGPGLHHRPPRTAWSGSALTGLVWSGPSPPSGGWRGCLALAGSFWKERTGDYVRKLCLER